MSILFLLKGMLIGIIIGTPVGAMGMLVIQRTLKKGMKEGLLTGLGSSVADCIYAAVGAFGVTMVSDFIEKYQSYINMVAAAILLCFGLHLMRKKAQRVEGGDEEEFRIKTFLSSFVVGITNPAAFFGFLLAFSYFNFGDSLGMVNAALLVTGVFIGTYFWWLLLANIVCRFRERATRHEGAINVVSGILLIVFAVVILIKTLYPLISSQ